MSDPLDLLTLPEAKLILDISSTDVTRDSRLAAVVTGVSRKLDRCIGPTVRRTVSDEQHWNPWRSIELAWCPVASVSSVVEYSGTSTTTLTEETAGTQPSDGWLGKRYRPDPGLYSGVIVRRFSGMPGRFGCGSVVKVTYSAGRTTSTETVDVRIKEAAGLMLRNAWRAQQLSVGRVDEFDVPHQSFPGFAVPNAVRESLSDLWRSEVGFGA